MCEILGQEGQFSKTSSCFLKNQALPLRLQYSDSRPCTFIHVFILSEVVPNVESAATIADLLCCGCIAAVAFYGMEFKSKHGKDAADPDTKLAAWARNHDSNSLRRVVNFQTR